VSGRLAEIEVGDAGMLAAPAADLDAARAAAEADPEVWAVLVLAGADALAAAPDAGPVPAATTPWAKPLVLAVDGVVSGAGLGLAACADAIVAGPDASFVLPAADAAGPDREILLRCSAQLPYRVVTALTMARRPLSAARAHEVGFVTELADAEGLADAARGWGEAFAAVPPGAAEGIRQAASEGLGLCLAEAIAERYEAVGRYAGSADAAEAVRALLEGRRPLWHGH
jgi:enoyl-CoA hydratase/carnithine racemase